MKQTWILGVGLICSIAISSCQTKLTNADIAKEQKTACMEDTIMKTIYGEQADDYCNCIAEKISALQETEPASEEKKKEIKQTCKNKYTTLDTYF